MMFSETNLGNKSVSFGFVSMSVSERTGSWITLICALSLFPAIISASDVFEGFLRAGPCFDISASPKCNTTLAESFQPQTPKSGDNEPTTFAFLFTPKSPDKAEPLHLCGGRLPPGSTYEPSADTEIIIHGWLDGVCRTAWMREMKEQFFLRGSYNVILVDWTWGNTPDYLSAGLNSRIVGEQVGFIINNIMRQAKCGPEKFHIIGHSFGAIAAGYSGRCVRGLKRITALDPAYAPYGHAPPNQRLTYRDAKIVDVIHSNSFECFALGVGDSRQIGHADFYPNGGSFQTSCYPYSFKSLLKLDILYGLVGLVEPRLCSHLQSIQFFKVSINSNDCEFVGVADCSYEKFLKKKPVICDSDWAVMGMNYDLYNHKNIKIRKKYFLKTLNDCPYYDSSYLGKKKFPFNVSCTT